MYAGQTLVGSHGELPVWYLAGMAEVIVYSRQGCHLCEVVKDSLRQLARRAQFTWKEVDVDSDPELQRLYSEEVPVVFIDGRKAFKYHLDEEQFLRRLRG